MGPQESPGPSQVALVVKNPPANAGDTELWVRSLGQEDPLEKEMATHSSILAWRMPWTEEPGGCSPQDHIVGPAEHSRGHLACGLILLHLTVLKKLQYRDRKSFLEIYLIAEKPARVA